ncbi:MAG: hypothetical protein RSC64_06345 [Hydrogenoanaerobacterium sp.]
MSNIFKIGMQHFAANAIAYPEVCQKFIDEELEARSFSQWMVPNENEIEFTGGKDVKIAQLSVSGLGNYDAANANSKYPSGSVKLAWSTYSMEMDRAIRFELGRLDPEDTGFLATTENVTRTFARKQLVPEQDMFRYNRIYNALAASASYKDSHIKKLAAAASAANLVAAVSELYTAVKEDSGEDADFICVMSLKNEQAFRDASKNNNNSVVFNKTVTINGISYTKGMEINGLPCIFVPSSRLKTLIKVNDGRSTGQELGGIVADSTAEQIEFMIMSSDAPAACDKIDSLKIFPADKNQLGDETTINYHLLYDLWVLKSHIVTLAACVRSKT